MTPAEKAKASFETYCAMDAPKLPEGPHALSTLQVQLARWQNENFTATTNEHLALGIAEEAGELCHAILKHVQKIRGMADRDAYRAAALDAVADISIYCMNLCTGLRADYGTLIEETAQNVMKRNWNKDKQTGGEG